MSEEKEVAPKKPIYKKWWFYVVIIAVIMGATGQFDEEEAPASAPVVAEEKAEAKPKKEEPPKELTLDEKVNKALGKDVVESNLSDMEGGKMVTATLTASENLTVNMTREGIVIDAVKTLEKLFANKEVVYVNITWQLPLVDQYGNEEAGDVVRVEMDRATADKINWDNFNRDNLASVATSYWVHPALNE